MAVPARSLQPSPSLSLCRNEGSGKSETAQAFFFIQVWRWTTIIKTATGSHPGANQYDDIALCGPFFCCL
jgi:hypothetical protein